LNEDGRAETIFGGNYTVQSGDAETIFNKMQEVIDEKGDTLFSKLVGLGSDGASVMMGRHSGVGVRLKGASPFCIHVHCVAHRIALASSNAAKKTAKVKEFRDTANCIFHFFQHSAARYGRLRELTAAMSDEDFSSLKEPCSVRWLSLSRSVASLDKNWAVLYLELGEEAARNNPKAEGLLRAIKSFSFVATMKMLRDVLPIVDRLNLIFQRDNVNLGIIRPMVESTVLYNTDMFLL
ncbi:zinc finger protein 862-like, partial [Saccoglossus kowalevskii]